MTTFSGQPWALVWLALAWVLYGAAHSALASLTVKRWVAARRPRWLAGYRLAFNAAAVLLLLPMAILFLHARTTPLWQWPPPWSLLADGLALAAVFGFVWSLRWYDGAEFLGLKQWRRRETRVEDQESFHLSPLHRFVRHPWYALGLVIIWTRPMDPALLVSAIAITLYFVVGSRLEERKLLRYHGEVYRRYRAQVPGLVPRPWRFLSRREAAALVSAARRQG